MNEIKCPNCGEEFSIDENYYNKIVKQIRDKEFANEVKNIEAKYDKDMEHLLQLSRMELQKGYVPSWRLYKGKSFFLLIL